MRSDFMKALCGLVLICVLLSCQDPIPKDDRIKLIIDSDTANEVDDLYAIVRALTAPSLNVIGINSSQFHTSPLASDTSVLESQSMNQDILRLMKVDDIPLPIGSNVAMSSPIVPASSQASRFIVDQVSKLKDAEILHIAILGSCTNVASAIVEYPSIISKIAVHYLGFWHDVDRNIIDKKEFNSANDTIAVNLLLNTQGLNFNVMTATTCQHLVFDKTTVDENLKSKGKIQDYMVSRWDTIDRWWTQDDPEKNNWIMRDVAIIEALINPHLAVKETFNTPPENTKRYFKAYTSIEVDAMKKEFWEAMKTLENQ